MVNLGVKVSERNIDVDSLVGIIPVDENWTDEAIAYFRKLTLNATMVAHFTETHLSDRNGVTYPIEVILIEDQIRCRIGDIMTEQRLAKTA